MADKKNEIEQSKLNSYLSWNDFKLVCRKQLHSDSINTPRLHSHLDFYELVVVVDGVGLHRTCNRDQRITSGNVFLIEPRQPHEYVEYDNLVIFNLLFSHKFVRYFLPDLTRLDGFQLIFNLKTHAVAQNIEDGIRIDEKGFPEILRVLEEMDYCNTSLAPGDQTLLLSDFVRVMLLLSRHCVWSGPPRQLLHIAQLTTLLTELERHCAEPWTLEKMAGRCHMSVSAFRQEFKTLTDMPPIEYLLHLRLERAAILLKMPGRSLADIAAECGFNDVNYFSRQFKRRYHVLPSRWRRSEV